MGFRHTAEESARGNGGAAADAFDRRPFAAPVHVPRPRRGRGHRNGSLPRRGRRSKARRRGLRRLLSRLPPPLVGGLLDPMRGAQVPSQRKGVREPPVTFRTLQPLGASRSVRRHAGGPYPWQRDQTIADGREHATEVLHHSPLAHYSTDGRGSLGAGAVRRASLATENVTVAYRSRESAASGEVIRECREATGPSTV